MIIKVKYKHVKKKGWILLLLSFCFTITFSQTTIVKGVVTDSATNKPLRNVNVVIKGSPKGAISDARGNYSIEAEGSYSTIEFSYIGYKSVTRSINPGQEQELNISLATEANVLRSVTVTRKNKVRYRNKDNPAVALIRKVIENKSNNRMESYDYVEYEKYEKLEFSLSNVSEKIQNSKLARKYKFLLENRDTTRFQGRALLPVYLEEILSKEYYRKNPEKKKTIITADRKVNFGEYVDNAGLSLYIKHIYQDIDIYDNNIPLLTNQFLSPIADLAPTFYMFFIKDTVLIDEKSFVRLYFSPRNKNDLLFQGTMYISLDSNYAVRKINMSTNKNINLNWVNDLEVTLDFDKNSDGRYHLSKSDLIANFGLTKEKKKGIFGERMVSYKDFKINDPRENEIYKGAAVVTLDNEAAKTDSFWVTHRHDTLSIAESKVYANIDSLQKMRSFRRTMDIITLFLAGYKSAGPFEVGPVSTFYSFNPVEGFRLRFGGRTTPNLSKRFYFENYFAYGFKDKRWKYFFSTTYSLNNKSIYTYPLNYVRASYQRETKIPGQDLQFVQEDNFLLSFKRGKNDKWLYNNIAKLEYVHEFSSHLSYNIGFKNWKQTPAGSLVYTQEVNNQTVIVPNLTTSELSLELRYAPNEKFFQGKLYRTPIPNQYPIITLRLADGVKGLVNGEYNYQNVSLNIFKRFYLSQLGYTDVVAEGAYIFGQLPYPLLDIHRANQTYAYQLNSYNLMNFLEFVSDHYASLYIDQSFNGFFFNKIPLLKKLKLREIVTMKLLYGGIREENKPDKNPFLFKLPSYDGVAATYSLEKEPYIEVSAGVSNIFKLLRVDVVKRLTYLNHPEISQWGIRGRVKFDF